MIARALKLINGIPTSIEVEGTGVFTKIFLMQDWVLVGNDYELLIPESEHGLGANLSVIIEELDGSNYEQVDSVVKNNNGNIKILINNDLRFIGRVLIKQ